MDLADRTDLTSVKDLTVFTVLADLINQMGLAYFVPNWFGDKVRDQADQTDFDDLKN